jgi:hypothetical protein
MVVVAVVLVVTEVREMIENAVMMRMNSRARQHGFESYLGHLLIV